jgi:predicted MFS family arabinose efflux permease
MRHIWSAFRGNSRTATLTGLLWVAALVPLMPYDPLFRLHVGMSEAEIGYLRSLDFAVRCLMIWMSGYAADRFGPSRVLFYGDILSWVIPGALMATASGPPQVVAATLLFATNGICFAAFQQVLIGGAPSSGRRYVLAAHAVFNLIPGILMPSIGGALVARFGLDIAVRAMYAGLCLSTAVGILIRLRLFRETRPPVAPSAPPHRILARPGILPLFLAGILLGSSEAVIGTYMSVYLVQSLRLGPAWLSALQVGQGFVVLAMNLFLFPRLSRRNERRLISLRGVIAATAIAAIMTGRPESLVIWMIGSSAAAAIKQTAHHARWVNALPPTDRSRLLGTAAAIAQIVAAVVMIPVSMLYGAGHIGIVFGAAIFLEIGSAILTLRALTPSPRG